MVNRRSNKGTIIDMDAIMAANEKSVAVGNMGVNAKGETVQDGVVVQSSEDRVRAYYKNNPKSSTAQASIKGQRPTLTPDANEQQPVMDVKTENLRTMQEPSVSDTVDEVIADKENLSISDIPPEVAEPEEFDAPEGATPLGFKEVELPNGDIDMVPYYREEDK
jgi:hypothetical protein